MPIVLDLDVGPVATNTIASAVIGRAVGGTSSREMETAMKDAQSLSRDTAAFFVMTEKGFSARDDAAVARRMIPPPMSRRASAATAAFAAGVSAAVSDHLKAGTLVIQDGKVVVAPEVLRARK